MMQCMVVGSGPKFKFTCDSAKLVTVISKVFNVTSFANCGEGDRHHIVSSYKGKVFVIGQTPETFVALELDDVESDNDGSFEFDPVAIKGLIKNRKDLEFEFDGSRLNLKATKGRYKANYVTTAISDEQLPYFNAMLKPLKATSNGSLGGDIVDKIREGVKYTSLTDFYQDSNSQLICYIVAKGKKLSIGSWDNFHMAQYKSKINLPKGSEFKLPISAAAFRLIDKFISEEEQESQFFAQSKFFKVQGERFVITLPPVQVEPEHFTVIDVYLSTLKDSICEMHFNTAGTRTVDNMFTIAKDDSKLTISVNSNGKVGIVLNTEQGSVSDAFKSDHVVMDGSKLEFKVDPRIFADLFRKVSSGSDLPMRLYGKKNKTVSSSFVISHEPDDTSKLTLIGTYYE